MRLEEILDLRIQSMVKVLFEEVTKVIRDKVT